MSDEYTIAFFHPEAYLLTEKTVDQTGQLESRSEYENEDGFVVNYEEALEILDAGEEDILEETRDERPHVFGYLDGDIREGVQEEVGDANAIVTSTVGERLVESREYDWRKSSLEGVKAVVTLNDPTDVWSRYRINSQEPVASPGLEDPWNSAKVKSD